MQIVNDLEWYHYLIFLVILVFSIIVFTYFNSRFLSLRHTSIMRSLDEKYLSTKITILKQKLLALDTKESIEKELLEIRELESKLDIDLYDFSAEIKVWEDTMTKVKKRGYI